MCRCLPQHLRVYHCGSRTGPCGSLAAAAGLGSSQQELPPCPVKCICFLAQQPLVFCSQEGAVKHPTLRYPLSPVSGLSPHTHTVSVLGPPAAAQRVQEAKESTREGEQGQYRRKRGAGLTPIAHLFHFYCKTRPTRARLQAPAQGHCSWAAGRPSRGVMKQPRDTGSSRQPTE